MTDKRPLHVDEMIKYLYNHKKVRFNEIIPDAAKEILLTNNYINVISPFKHYFCNGSKGEDGKHVYNSEVEFKSYYEKFVEDDNHSKIILHNILSFERMFNAVFSYYVANEYKEVCEFNFLRFINDVEEELDNRFNNNGQVKERISNHIKKLRKDYARYHNPYVCLDRLSFGALRDIYSYANKKIKNRVYTELRKRKMNLKTTNYENFIDILFEVVAIRNVVAHNNSLEIYIRYFNVEKNQLRRTQDAYKKRKLVKYLLCLK